jgi:hypothetical protein
MWSGFAAAGRGSSLTLLSRSLRSLRYFATQIVVPKYRHLLFSTISGKQYSQDHFLEGNTDEEKMQVFRANRLHWEADIGEEVKAWTLENWARLEGKAWFDAKIKEKVPDGYIPAEALQKLGGRMRKRRGSAARSIKESMGGGEGGGEVVEEEGTGGGV